MVVVHVLWIGNAHSMCSMYSTQDTLYYIVHMVVSIAKIKNNILKCAEKNCDIIV